MNDMRGSELGDYTRFFPAGIVGMAEKSYPDCDGVLDCHPGILSLIYWFDSVSGKTIENSI
jgi:hypothetical protein